MQYISQPQSTVQTLKNQDRVGISIILDQLWEISSPKSVTNRRKDVIRDIQPKFVYQSTSLDYYELVDH